MFIVTPIFKSMKTLPLYRNFGFTLIELLVTIGLMAIVTSLALPSFTRMINEGKQNSNAKGFMGSLSIARSEAIKRSARVVICASTNGTSCGTSINWDSGWIIFVDSDTDGVVDGNEELLKVYPAMDMGNTLVGSGDVVRRVRYESTGVSLETGEITLCDNRGVSSAEAIIMKASGRAVLSDSGACGATLVCP